MSNQSDGPWTEANVVTLKALWREGLSARQIAHKLGFRISRNAVIGKVHRLGLTVRKPRISVPALARRRRQRKEAKAKEIAKPKRPLFNVDPFAPREPIHVPPHERKHLVDLEPHHCRYPLGMPGEPDYGFCGRTKHIGVSYCLDHALVAFTVPSPSRRPAYDPARPFKPTHSNIKELTE